MDIKFPLAYINELRNVKQALEELLQQFAERTMNLSSMTYSSGDLASRELNAVQAFILGCRDKTAARTVRAG